MCKTAYNLWSLKESSRVARVALSDAAGVSLDNWSEVYEGYLSAKRALIDALDPATGRREIPVEMVLDAGGSLMAFKQSLTSAVFEDRPLSRLPGPDDVGPTHKPPVGMSYPDQLHSFGIAVSGTECLSGTVVKDSGLTRLCPDIRPGMKLTRALGAYLRAHGATNDVSSEIVDFVASRAGKARKGTVVVSANILDILTCSENCAYDSCHKFDGCYRAGPQAYLQDVHTITVYYSEGPRQKFGHALPYKLFRQMVYVDASKGAATMMRHYGQTMPEEVHQTIRREIALLLARLKGIEGEPVWYRHDGGPCPENDEKLAYTDPRVETVQLTKGEEGRPEIELATGIPCPSCDNETLDAHDCLTCKSCSDNRGECDSCNRRIGEDDSHTDNDGNTYCDDCYNERYTSCERCGTEMCADGDEIHTGPNGNNYCERCFDSAFFRCQECEDPFRQNDGVSVERCDGYYCPGCADDLTATCEGCECLHLHDDLTDGRCADCGPEEEPEEEFVSLSFVAFRALASLLS